MSSSRNSLHRHRTRPRYRVFELISKCRRRFPPGSSYLREKLVNARTPTNRDGAYWSWVELGRLFPSRLVMYSVFRNHVTAGTTCDELEPPAELLTNNDDPAVESPSRNWSLGSSFGRFFGSGFSAIRKPRKRVQVAIISRNTGRSLDWVGSKTHLNHRHRPSTNIPKVLNLMACHTPRRQS